MKLSNNRGDRTPTGHLLSPNEASSTRNGLHLIKFITKGYHGNPQITQAIAQVIKSFPQTDGKALLLETTSTQFTEHREVKLVPSFTPTEQFME